MFNLKIAVYHFTSPLPPIHSWLEIAWIFLCCGWWATYVRVPFFAWLFTLVIPACSHLYTFIISLFITFFIVSLCFVVVEVLCTCKSFISWDMCIRCCISLKKKASFMCLSEHKSNRVKWIWMWHTWVNWTENFDFQKLIKMADLSKLFVTDLCELECDRLKWKRVKDFKVLNSPYQYVIYFTH